MSKKISLALSGSGYLFYVHIGAVVALEEKGYTFVELSGTSGGSIIAMLISLGFTGQQIKEKAFSQDWSNAMKFRWFAFWDWSSGLCNSDTLYNILLNLSENKTLKEAIIPIHIVSTNLTTGHPFIFNSVTMPDTLLAKACLASASVPFVYPMTDIDGSKMIDGGVSFDLPLNILSGDNKIAISISSDMPLMSKNVSMLDRAKRIMELMLASNSRVEYALAQTENAKIVKVSSLGYSAFDTTLTDTQKQELFDEGYNAVKNDPTV